MGDCINREDALHFMNAQREQIKKQMDEALVYEHFHTRSDLKCALLQLEGDIFLLESMSAADVAPVVHARWKRVDYHFGGHDYFCTACEYKGGNDRASKYCPDCGATMDADMQEVQDG